MRGRRVVAGLLALVVITSMAAPALAGAAVNHSADAAQNPTLSTDVTKASHTIGEMSAAEYEDNSGEIATLDATVNKSSDTADVGTGYVNPYAFTATDINATDYDAFPHDKSDVSALTASEWSTDASGSAGSISVSDVTTAPDVEAVQISTSSQTSSDVATATFSNFSVTSDAEKRYVQTVLDVNTLDSATELELRINDADADYVSAQINASADASNEDAIANATGEGLVYQRQVGSMTVQGSGDGTMSEIQSIEVNVADGDASVDIAGLNVEKTSEWTFGNERVDSDDDDEFETNTITEVSTAGDIAIHDLSTMGATFDGAVVSDITMPMEFQASNLDTGDSSLINMTFSEASGYPSFEFMQDTYYRLELPDAYDLSYSNAKLTQEVSVPDSRYDTLEIVEGADGNDFTDLSSWTDVSGSITSQGETVTLDDTIQPGQEIALHYKVLTTQDEKAQLTATGGAGQFGDSGGGFLDALFSPLGALAAGAGAILARARGLI